MKIGWRWPRFYALTAQSAWEAIKTVRIGTRCVREANEQLLRWEFADARFNDGENVEDFSVL